MFKDMFGTDDLHSIKEEVYEKMDNMVRIKVNDSGSMNLCANRHEAMEANIVVFGAIISDDGSDIQTFKQAI